MLDILESRLNKLKLDKEYFHNSFGRITPAYSPTAQIYYNSLDVRINELELVINDVKKYNDTQSICDTCKCNVKIYKDDMCEACSEWTNE